MRICRRPSRAPVASLARPAATLCAVRCRYCLGCVAWVGNGCAVSASRALVLRGRSRSRFAPVPRVAQATASRSCLAGGRRVGRCAGAVRQSHHDLRGAQPVRIAVCTSGAEQAAATHTVRSGLAALLRHVQVIAAGLRRHVRLRASGRDLRRCNVPRLHRASRCGTRRVGFKSGVISGLHRQGRVTGALRAVCRDVIAGDRRHGCRRAVVPGRANPRAAGIAQTRSGAVATGGARRLRR